MDQISLPPGEIQMISLKLEQLNNTLISSLRGDWWENQWLVSVVSILVGVMIGHLPEYLRRRHETLQRWYLHVTSTGFSNIFERALGEYRQKAMLFHGRIVRPQSYSDAFLYLFRGEFPYQHFPRGSRLRCLFYRVERIMSAFPDVDREIKHEDLVPHLETLYEYREASALIDLILDTSATEIETPQTG